MTIKNVLLLPLRSSLWHLSLVSLVLMSLLSFLSFDLSYAKTNDHHVFCNGAFWFSRHDEHQNDRSSSSTSDEWYLYAHTVQNGMIVPSTVWPESLSLLSEQEEDEDQNPKINENTIRHLSQNDFMTVLEKVIQHNFAIHHDIHTAQYHLNPAPFVWMDFFEILRLKKFHCSSTASTTGSSNNHSPHPPGIWTDTESSQVTRMALSKLYMELPEMKNLTHWVHPLKSFCTWKGITCDTNWNIQEVRLTHMSLKGTLPSELGLIPSLPVLDLTGNRLYGTIPVELFSNIQYLDLSGNQFTSCAVWDYENNSTGNEMNMEYLDISANHFSGTFPSHWKQSLNHLRVLDASRNAFTGTLILPEQLPSLEMLFLGSNLFTGTIPSIPATTTSLKLLDLGQNIFTGPILSSSLPSSLEAIVLADNQLTGEHTLDRFAALSHLEVLQLQNNHLKGTIPITTQWSELGTFSIRNNQFTGSIPSQFMRTVQKSLQYLDVAHNNLTGILSSEIGNLKRLRTIDAAVNRLRGTLPNEMMKLEPNLRLNFSDNNLIGTVPSLFCGHGTANMLYREFGCDAVLCRRGTFNPHGHATLYAGCRPCPDDDTLLGRTRCETVEFVHGDLNADGILSVREVLRVMFIDLMGRFWGKTFQSWADMSVHECNLIGVVCNENGSVIKIDLSAATICSDGDGRPGPIQYCKGLPTVLGALSTLEFFSAKASPFLRGTIPTELGNLNRIQVLDLSGPNSLSGTIPTELGHLTRLHSLSLSNTRLRGSMPSEIYNISSLTKLHLANNMLTGTFPTSFGRLSNLQDLVVSRNRLHGTIPTEISGAIHLENFEAYANFLSGPIPSEIGMCEKLKRIDLFSNQLNGTIPSELANLSWLQIIHLKKNQLTGTIPSSLGTLEYLSWLDASENVLSGTIPPSFADIRVLRDFRLGGNRIYDPIPTELCKSTVVNSGATKRFGCDAILCPLGTYAEDGLATNDHGCKPCPEGETTMYLGSRKCLRLSEKDILSIFFGVMDGDEWPEDDKKNWGDETVDVCEWGGITCSEDGEVESISFPTTVRAIPTYGE